MVTSNLLGGIGNVMFQIAATYSLSLENDDQMVYNINDVVGGHKNIRTYINNILRNVKFVDYSLPINNNYNEPFFHYNKINYKNDLKLNGYFQSEKYFLKHKKEINNLFSINEENLDYINQKYGHLLNQKNCSLHIRRGDYLNYPNHHPLCSLEYYKTAMSHIGDDVNYLIFSNDINWCKNNFNGSNIHFIENDRDYIDIWLMSLCDNNIIANSSFSWWGAWMNNNENKKVIAPKNWFGPAINHNTNDLYCDEWILL